MAHLQNKYKVASYRKLTKVKGVSAISWLKQEIGKATPSLRRTNNDEWRKRHNSAIYTACGKWDGPSRDFMNSLLVILASKSRSPLSMTSASGTSKSCGIE